MKPIETLFWLGTAGILYMTANCIVKNVARDVIHDIERHEIEKKERRRWLDGRSVYIAIITTGNALRTCNFSFISITVY
jgi:hypothetical protein